MQTLLERLKEHREELTKMKEQVEKFGGPNMRVSVKDPDVLINLLKEAEDEIAKLRRLLMGGRNYGLDNDYYGKQ